MRIEKITFVLLFCTFQPTLVLADGGEAGLNSDQQELEEQRLPTPLRQRTEPKPPGSTSEDGEMKVWDTRGPVEVSPHLPSSTDYNDSRSLPSGIIVDARPAVGSPPPVPRR